MKISLMMVMAATGAVVLAPSVAKAQQPYMPPQPQVTVTVQAGPQPPPDAVAPNGQYVAPMQQQTQQTYVPQSVAFSGPRVIKDWQEGEPIPPGYHVSTRVRSGLIAGGAAMFAAPYLISVLIAAAGQDLRDNNGGTNAAWPLFIPVAGPFITMGNVSNSSLADVFLVIDGLLQAGGVALFVAGVSWPKIVLVRNDLGKIEFMPSPIVGKNMSGVGLVGTF